MRSLAGFVMVLALASAAVAQDRTRAFLLHAMAVNRFQVSAAQLALKKSQSAAVQGFAHQLMLDYTAAGMKLRHIVTDARLSLPREALETPHKALLDGLARTAPGRTLSRAYLEAQDRTLRDDLAIFERYARDGDDERLALYAGDMVPLLRGQLDQLDKLRR